MNVAKQRRKLEQLAREVPPDHQEYIDYLLLCFDAEVDAGTPRPASEYIPLYREEFNLD